MADRVGQQLGNYTLVRLLGQGGFAEVYEGEHNVLKQKRAIKILHTTLTEQESHGFRTEAERLAQLSHPHIVPIVDFDEREGFPYLVMEYAPHGSLRNRHPKGTRVPLPTIIDYIKQIAPALQYIHDQKLIHRDIKPENLLIGANDQVLLSDIGLAEVAHSEQSRRTQLIGGTPHYMAPEQFKAKAVPASDQYSLGVVVYEWLSGKLPFEEGDFLQLGYQHTYETPRSLREIVPSIPSAIEDTVMTALAKEPNKRFANIQAFATALENEGKPKISKPISTQSQTSTPAAVVVPPKIASPITKEKFVKPQTKAASAIDKDALYRDGFVARSNGELDRAAQLWQQIIEVDSNYGNGTLANQLQTLHSQIRTQNIERLRQQAKAAQQSKQWEEEEIAWSSLLRLDPQNKEAKTRQQKLKYKQKQRDLAYLLQTAEKAKQNGQWQQEESAWQTLLQLAPDNEKAKRRLTKCYQLQAASARKTGDWTQEIKALENLKPLLSPKPVDAENVKRSSKGSLTIFDFPLERLLIIAQTNQQHEWMYNNASLFAQDDNYNAASDLLSDLWQRAPYYGDPAHLAKGLSIPVRKRESPATIYNRLSLTLAILVFIGFIGLILIAIFSTAGILAIFWDFIVILLMTIILATMIYFIYNVYGRPLK